MAKKVNLKAAAKKESKQDETSANTKKVIRYAVIGLGHIAQNAVLPAFKNATKNSKLVSLISGTPEKLRQLGEQYQIGNLYNYSQMEECIEKDAIDVVYITLPNSMHREYSLRALKAGANVLCEKPLTTSVSDCIEIVNFANSRKLKVMTAYRLHFDPANMKVVEMIKNKEIGEPKVFTSVFSYQVASDNIRVDAKLGGGSLFDLGVYAINASRYIFQEEPRWVAARLAKNDDDRFREVDGSCSALLLFSDNKIAQFTSSLCAGDAAYFEVVGTKGKIRLENAYEYSEDVELTCEVEGKTKTQIFKKHDQFAAELIYFSQCIQTDKEPEPSALEGLADLRVIEAIHQSSYNGKFIFVPDQQRDLRPSESQVIVRPALVRKPTQVEVSAPHQN